MKHARLGELFRDKRFAQEHAEFEIHAGARSFYNPEVPLLLCPGFVAATEGIRSFIFSVMIAGFLGIRWIIGRNRRRNEHKLDGLMHRLLEIELRQVPLGDSPDASDIGDLRSILDEVTFLRQEALRNFSAHELNEDQAMGCFIEMCAALTAKVNVKLSQQRLQTRIAELIEVVAALDRR